MMSDAGLLDVSICKMQVVFVSFPALESSISTCSSTSSSGLLSFIPLYHFSLFFTLVSFTSTTTLFFYLLYRLLISHLSSLLPCCASIVILYFLIHSIRSLQTTLAIEATQSHSFNSRLPSPSGHQSLKDL